MKKQLLSKRAIKSVPKTFPKVDERFAIGVIEKPGDNRFAVDKVATEVLERIDEFQMERKVEAERMIYRLEEIVKMIKAEFELKGKPTL